VPRTALAGEGLCDHPGRNNYTYEIDLDGDTAGSYVLSFIEPNQRVLEIGAGSGAIAKHIVGAKRCDLSAIEIVDASIEKLRSFTHDIEKLDLNDPAWVDTYASREKFDIVLAADVLEHVYDPWTVLAGMKKVMVEDGSIILSLPHIAHAAVLGTMASGDFKYGDWGLLDKTHMRFFCVRNVEALTASCGLKIVDAKAVRKLPEETEFVDIWMQLPTELQQAFEAYLSALVRPHKNALWISRRYPNDKDPSRGAVARFPQDVA